MRRTRSLARLEKNVSAPKGEYGLSGDRGECHARPVSDEEDLVSPPSPKNRYPCEHLNAEKT
jgi:hypothetical protein